MHSNSSSLSLFFKASLTGLNPLYLGNNDGCELIKKFLNQKIFLVFCMEIGQDSFTFTF